MPHAVRNIFNRLAFVSMILLALTCAMLAAPTQAGACAPGSEAATVAVSTESGPCAQGDCGDCVIACAHGCCNAPVMGVLGAAPLSFQPPRYTPPAGWTDTPGIPLGERTRLLRPPRD